MSTDRPDNYKASPAYAAARQANIRLMRPITDRVIASAEQIVRMLHGTRLETDPTLDPVDIRAVVMAQILPACARLAAEMGMSPEGFAACAVTLLKMEAGRADLEARTGGSHTEEELAQFLAAAAS